MEFHPTVDGKEIDFRIVGTNILLECDGRTYHGEFTDGFETDRSRDQETLGVGFLTMRFTWAQITRSPGTLARRMANVLRRWAPHLIVS